MTPIPDGSPDSLARSRRLPGRLVALSVVLVLVVAACSGSDAAPGAGSPLPSPEATEGMPDEAMDPRASGDLAVNPCVHVASVEERLAALATVELKLPNRVALDIELGKVLSAFSELDQADLGELEEQLEDPLRRLGYRMGDLELAVEDFRTNPRPKRAAPHVQLEAQNVFDSLAAFALLARC